MYIYMYIYIYIIAYIYIYIYIYICIHTYTQSMQDSYCTRGLHLDGVVLRKVTCCPSGVQG